MIDFENVTKAYPNGTLALDNVTLHVDDGEFVFIVGHSGAGKTALMILLLREEKATAGRIVVGDYDLTKIGRFTVPYYRRELGVVFQDFRLFPKKTVFENVAFAMHVIGTPSKAIKRRVPAILSTVNLTDKFNNYPHELSGGEQQRVSLARALVNNPEIIVADEPTGNIDPELSHEIIELLTRINTMGTTVLVVTHEHELVREFNQRVITLDMGRVVGDTAEKLVDVNTAAYEEMYEDAYEEVYDDSPEEYPEPAEAEPVGQHAAQEDIVDISSNSYSPAHFAPDAEDGAYEEELPQYPDNVVITPD